MQHHSKLLPAALVLSYLVAHLSAQSGGNIITFCTSLLKHTHIYICTYIVQQGVTMETFTWEIIPICTSMETISTAVEWKCAIMAPTVLCVMRVGLTVMLQLSVTTLVTAIHTIVSGN